MSGTPARAANSMRGSASPPRRGSPKAAITVSAASDPPVSDDWRPQLPADAGDEPSLWVGDERMLAHGDEAELRIRQRIHAAVVASMTRREGRVHAVRPSRRSAAQIESRRAAMPARPSSALRRCIQADRSGSTPPLTPHPARVVADARSRTWTDAARPHEGGSEDSRGTGHALVNVDAHNATRLPSEAASVRRPGATAHAAHVAHRTGRRRR